MKYGCFATSKKNQSAHNNKKLFCVITIEATKRKEIWDRKQFK